MMVYRDMRDRLLLTYEGNHSFYVSKYYIKPRYRPQQDADISSIANNNY